MKKTKLFSWIFVFVVVGSIFGTLTYADAITAKTAELTTSEKQTEKWINTDTPQQALIVGYTTAKNKVMELYESEYEDKVEISYSVDENGNSVRTRTTYFVRDDYRDGSERMTLFNMTATSYRESVCYDSNLNKYVPEYAGYGTIQLIENKEKLGLTKKYVREYIDCETKEITDVSYSIVA